MVLLLLEAADDDDGDDALDSPHPDGDRTAVDRVAAGLVLAQLEHPLETGLVVVVLASHVVRAMPPAEDGVPLPLHPDLLVRRDTGACDTLEQDLAAVRERDGNQGRPARGSEGGQTGAEQVAEIPGVVRRER